MSINGRLVSVDDADSSIKWDGPWFNVQGSTDDWGNHGPPFLRTLRGITTNGSFSFSFRGTSVSVWGSLRPRSITVSTGAGNVTVRDPDWDCLFDGESSGTQWEHPSEPRSNFELCSRGDLSEGDHTFELRATVHNETLWVDQVQYQATINADVSTAWTEVDYHDGRYTFSRNWGDGGNDGYGTATTTSSASFTYKFDGQGIILGGYTPGNANALDGLGTYSLDFGPPVEFRIPASTAMKTNQPYFNITDMEPGPHQLEVVNIGNASTAPLAFRYIYTKNAPIRASPPSQSSSTPGPPAQTTGAASQPPEPNGKPEIIGGAIGGVLGAILFAALLIYIIIRNRRHRKRAYRGRNLTPSAFVTEASMAFPSVASSDSLGPPNVPTMRAPGALLASRQQSSPLTQLSSTMPPSGYSSVPPQRPRSQSRPPSYEALSTPSPTFYTDQYPTISSAITPSSGVDTNRVRTWREKMVRG